LWSTSCRRIAPRGARGLESEVLPIGSERSEPPRPLQRGPNRWWVAGLGPKKTVGVRTSPVPKKCSGNVRKSLRLPGAVPAPQTARVLTPPWGLLFGGGHTIGQPSAPGARLSRPMTVGPSPGRRPRARRARARSRRQAGGKAAMDRGGRRQVARCGGGGPEWACTHGRRHPGGKAGGRSSPLAVARMSAEVASRDCADALNAASSAASSCRRRASHGGTMA
jgi:hypothetical protein